MQSLIESCSSRTNNWADYGGMDVYTKQILGSSNDHDAFYTNDNIKVSSACHMRPFPFAWATCACLVRTSANTPIQTAFKSYINAFVSRYADEPTILAWELANEPRCKGSPGCVLALFLYYPFFYPSLIHPLINSFISP